ncbi:MAG: hypothetical protein EU532_11530 [Promethearchaeota archaeon]|nr:MAG: hypothetical protein EU532_11530 [Candidatus Lokiarchaeota archaeon]
MSEFIDKNLMQQVFNSNEFKAWLLSKRWFGDKSTLSNLAFKVKIKYFQKISTQIYLNVIEINIEDYSKEYFLPLIRYDKLQEILEPKERKREVITALTESSFSKIIALEMVENIQDQVLPLNLVEAEYCVLFWKKLLFDKKISEMFPSMKLELSLYDEQFEDDQYLVKARNLIEAGLYPDKYDLSLEKIGGGNTTNVLFLLNLYKKDKTEIESSYVLKSYKEFSERIEPRTLFVLVKNKFPNSPKIYGMVKILGIESVGIIENVKNSGNLGDIYWREVYEMINDVFKNINDDYTYFRDKEEKNNTIKYYCVESLKVSAEIGLEIKNLHKALRLEGDDHYFKERVNSKEYLDNYSAKLEKMVNDIQNKIGRNTDKTFYNSPKIGSILLDIKDIIQKLKTEFDFEQITIQPVHQDLHMQQILYNRENGKYNFYFIDFEGDPQLTLKEKKSRYPIEKDLGSFLRSLSYIKFQTLLNYIEKKIIKKDRFEVPEEVLFTTFFRKSAKITKNQGLLEAVLNLLNSWEEKMMVKIFNKNLKLHFTLINYYSIERALHELEYELLFRPNKMIIPILGLKEIIDKG